MDRREAVLRELNLYPQWVLRNPPAPVVVEQPVAERSEAEHSEQIEKSEPEVVVVQEVQATVAEEVGRASARHVGLKPDLHWPELKQQVRDCTVCRLRAGCTQTVFGAGDEQADWLFVGEAPGADEDALGEPFVGEAGKLLDNMLLAIKLKRNKNVYITNVVKCHPPENHTPTTAEIAACLPYLHRQIELIQPKLIVALGKVASNALLREGDAESIGHPSASPLRGLNKDATLASLRGTLHDYHGIPLIVTYHPAYLLRTPSEKSQAWQDLCLAVKTLNGGA